MTQLLPCPACQRHVRNSESACPFCAVPLSPRAAVARPQRRMNRAAMFAAGATLAGVTACSSSTVPASGTDAAVHDGAAGGAAGGAGGQAGAGTATGGAGGTSGVAIYSAAFPPTKQG